MRRSILNHEDDGIGVPSCLWCQCWINWHHGFMPAMCQHTRNSENRQTWNRNIIFAYYTSDVDGRNVLFHQKWVVSIVPSCSFDLNWPLLISQAPLGRRPYFLILSQNSLSELWDRRIKNGVDCMGRSWDKLPQIGGGVNENERFEVNLLKEIWNLN